VRVKGKNWWEWVFVTTLAVLHVIQPSRGKAVVIALFGAIRPEALVARCMHICDQYPALVDGTGDRPLRFFCFEFATISDPPSLGARVPWRISWSNRHGIYPLPPWQACRCSEPDG
jgi:hypothetical protein